MHHLLAGIQPVPHKPLWENSSCQSVFVDSWWGGVSETLLVGLNGQNYVHDTTKMLFAFCALILSQMYSWVFQTLHNLWYCNRLLKEAERRIQMFSMKPDNKKKCDIVK